LNVKISEKFCRVVVKALVDACNSGDDFSVRSYSGRAMYGRSCIGVVGDSPLQCLAVIMPALFAEKDEIPAFDWELEDFLRSVSMDSMGLKSIVYFTDAPWYKELDGILYGTDVEDDSDDSEDNDECVDRDSVI
jgi:hypothetical protein